MQYKHLSEEAAETGALVFIRNTDRIMEEERKIRKGLAEKGLTNIQSQEEARKYQFYVSDQADKFMRFADSILPFDVNTTKKISIEEY